MVPGKWDANRRDDHSTCAGRVALPTLRIPGAEIETAEFSVQKPQKITVTAGL